MGRIFSLRISNHQDVNFKYFTLLFVKFSSKIILHICGPHNFYFTLQENVSVDNGFKSHINKFLLIEDSSEQDGDQWFKIVGLRHFDGVYNLYTHTHTQNGARLLCLDSWISVQFTSPSPL